MVHSYSDVEVDIGGTSLFCSSAELQVSHDVAPVRSPGYKGSLGTIPTGEQQGSASFTFLGGCPERPTDFSDVDSIKKLIKLGGASGYGYPTSLSVDVRPHEVVGGSGSYVFFEPIVGGYGIGGGSSSTVSRSAIFDGGHGSFATGVQFSANYSFSASWNAVRLVGNYCPEHIYATDASEQITLEGYDIGGAIGSCKEAAVGECDEDCPEICMDNETLTFTINSPCGSYAQTFTVTGPVIESKLRVAEGGVLTGSITVKNFLI